MTKAQYKTGVSKPQLFSLATNTQWNPIPIVTLDRMGGRCADLSTGIRARNTAVLSLAMRSGSNTGSRGGPQYRQHWRVVALATRPSPSPPGSLQ